MQQVRTEVLLSSQRDVGRCVVRMLLRACQSSDTNILPLAVPFPASGRALCPASQELMTLWTFLLDPDLDQTAAAASGWPSCLVTSIQSLQQLQFFVLRLSTAIIPVTSPTAPIHRLTRRGCGATTSLTSPEAHKGR